jgi:lysophospholipase L1-like esterase
MIMSGMRSIDSAFVSGQFHVARRGLGTVGAKLAAGEDVTVVFFGGSITWGGQASDIDQSSYRALTTKWLKQQYPQSKITSINSGIGGTGSDLGVFRCQTDVLDHQPDLVFVEFAVNDGGMDDYKSMETYEAILRQLISAEKKPDICIVYTIEQQHLELWQEGKLSPRAATQEQLAVLYNLPSVKMAAGIAMDVLEGKATWEELMSDSVHPLDGGHAVYTNVLSSCLRTMFEQQSDDCISLPTPSTTDRYFKSTMQPLPKDVPGWTWIELENKGGWECFNGLLVAEKPGTELTLTFSGKLVGLYYQLGPETGNLHYSIDNGVEKLLEPFDKWAPTCTRPQYRILNDELTIGQHTITLRISESSDPQSKGTWARLAHLMIG